MENNQNQKIKKVVELMREISIKWNEKDDMMESVVYYPKTLMSFDELIEEIDLIKFKEK